MEELRRPALKAEAFVGVTQRSGSQVV